MRTSSPLSSGVVHWLKSEAQHGMLPDMDLVDVVRRHSGLDDKRIGFRHDHHGTLVRLHDAAPGMHAPLKDLPILRSDKVDASKRSETTSGWRIGVHPLDPASNNFLGAQASRPTSSITRARLRSLERRRFPECGSCVSQGIHLSTSRFLPDCETVAALPIAACSWSAQLRFVEYFPLARICKALALRKSEHMPCRGAFLALSRLQDFRLHQLSRQFRKRYLSRPPQRSFCLASSGVSLEPKAPANICSTVATFRNLSSPRQLGGPIPS